MRLKTFSTTPWTLFRDQGLGGSNPLSRVCKELIFNRTLPNPGKQNSVTGASAKVLKSSSKARQDNLHEKASNSGWAVHAVEWTVRYACSKSTENCFCPGFARSRGLLAEARQWYRRRAIERIDLRKVFSIE